jgi:hypothetical protein
LIEIASRTHQVHLAALLDSPIRLEQWRMLARRTEKLAIIPRSMGTGERRLRRKIEPWIAQHRFDAVLCGATAMWPIISHVEADFRACDTRINRGRVWRRIRGRVRGRFDVQALPVDVMQLHDAASQDRLCALLGQTDRVAAPLAITTTTTVPLTRAA